MKWDKVIPKEKWSSAKTERQIDRVWAEIKSFNRDQNKIDSRINDLKNQKKIIGRKISDKHRYIKQLEDQLKEINGLT